jgi:hypothetical protein
MISDALGNEIRVGDTILYALGCERSSGCLAMYIVTQAEEYQKQERTWNRSQMKWQDTVRDKVRFAGKPVPLPGEAAWSYEPKGVALRHPKAALVVTDLDLLALTRTGGRNHE